MTNKQMKKELMKDPKIKEAFIKSNKLKRKAFNFVVWCLMDLALRPDTKRVKQDRSNWTKKLHKIFLELSNK